MLNFINQLTMNKIKMYAYYFTCKLFGHLTEMFKKIDINTDYSIKQLKLKIKELEDKEHKESISLTRLQSSNMLRLLDDSIQIKHFERTDITSLLIYLKSKNKEELYHFFQNLK
jgi:hypothetical protein